MLHAPLGLRFSGWWQGHVSPSWPATWGFQARTRPAKAYCSPFVTGFRTRHGIAAPLLQRMPSWSEQVGAVGLLFRTSPILPVGVPTHRLESRQSLQTTIPDPNTLIVGRPPFWC